MVKRKEKVTLKLNEEYNEKEDTYVCMREKEREKRANRNKRHAKEGKRDTAKIKKKMDRKKTKI